MKNSTNEYVIWGVPKDGSDERLLVAKIGGSPIVDISIVNRYMDKLKTLGCVKLRIQTIEFNGEFDWMKATGLRKR